MILLRRLCAWLGGYFWMRCPVCGDMFGGHEKHAGNVTTPDGRTRVTCARCHGSFVEVAGHAWEVGVRFVEGAATLVFYAAERQPEPTRDQMDEAARVLRKPSIGATS